MSDPPRVSVSLIKSLFSCNYPNGNGKNAADGEINRSVNMSGCMPRVQLTFTFNFAHRRGSTMCITKNFISLMERAAFERLQNRDFKD